MNKKFEQSKVKQAILKAVRKISGASFSKKLGDYSICFTVTHQISIISFYVTKCDEHAACFSNPLQLEKASGWQALFPENESKIPEFEAEVEKALAEVFEFVKNNK